MTGFPSSPFPTYNTSNNSSDFTAFTPSEKLALSISVTVVSFFGTIGNLLVIICILNQEINSSVSDNPTNLLLLNQAVADLLLSCAGGLAYCYILYEPRAVIVSGPLGEFTGAASLGNLALLTLNRFVSIHYALKYPRIVTPSRTKAAIALNWTICLVFGALSTIGFLIDLRQITGLLKFHIVASIIIVVACYVYMYRKARHHRKEMRRVTYRLTGHQAGLDKDLKSVFSLLLFFGIFLVTWTPLTIFSLVCKKEDNPKSFRRTFLFLLPLIILNSAIDPVIYYCRSAKFRQILRRFERR